MKQNETWLVLNHTIKINQTTVLSLDNLLYRLGDGGLAVLHIDRDTRPYCLAVIVVELRRETSSQSNFYLDTKFEFTFELALQDPILICILTFWGSLSILRFPPPNFPRTRNATWAILSTGLLRVFHNACVMKYIHQHRLHLLIIIPIWCKKNWLANEC